MTPTEDTRSTFCLRRAAASVVAGARSGSWPVRTASAPKLAPAIRPFTFPPTRSGTSRPWSSPTVRLKKGTTSTCRSTVKAKSKMSDPSRKKPRFSGKKSGNRVRLVRRASTSVSAKSVFRVTEARVFAPSRWLRSPLTSRRVLRASAGSGCSTPLTSAGRTVRPSPYTNAGSPTSRPARAGWVSRAARDGLDHRLSSRRRWMRRSTLNPHCRSPSLKERLCTGIRISTDHPCAVRVAAASQAVSHSLRSLSPAFVISASYRAPIGFTAKT
ncbi:MAG TPA: hypothetical protein VFU46_05385, partial [Gemmatimonadales bacterium]|nr:hypothetical protein [Gemmatimonadales bacterium]